MCEGVGLVVHDFYRLLSLTEVVWLYVAPASNLYGCWLFDYSFASVFGVIVRGCVQVCAFRRVCGCAQVVT